MKPRLDLDTRRLCGWSNLRVKADTFHFGLDPR